MNSTKERACGRIHRLVTVSGLVGSMDKLGLALPVSCDATAPMPGTYLRPIGSLFGSTKVAPLYVDVLDPLGSEFSAISSIRQ